MSYLPKVSLSANGVKEERSVILIRTLLMGKTKNNIVEDNTMANIDGYIELVDDEGRPIGKLTVQVKTVSHDDEGKNRYPCPTSLFAYAERMPDNVFLLAADHSQNKVLFKYISRKLLNDNRDKENQETITLHFDSNEELKEDNIDAVIEIWKQICHEKTKFLNTFDNIVEENAELKKSLLKMSGNLHHLSDSDISEIQKFSDIYNELLANEFKYIKEVLFPNTWKRGLVIYSYTEKSLEYSLFSIKNGEFISPIIQMERQSIFELPPKFDIAFFSQSENQIKEKKEETALKLVKKHVDEFIKSKKIIPFDEIFLIEFIHDFIADNARRFKYTKYSSINIEQLIQYFLTNYPNIESIQIRQISGNKSIYLNTVYDALKSLYELGYREIEYPYPKKQYRGTTGFITDLYTRETAYQKAEKVIISTFKVYQSFILKEFPLLKEELDLFYGANLLFVLFDYFPTEGHGLINLYYFKTYTESTEKIILMEDFNNSSFINENNIQDFHEFFSKKAITFKGIPYEIIRGEGIHDRKILFDKYNCLTFFYEILKRRFDDFFKSKGIKN